MDRGLQHEQDRQRRLLGRLADDDGVVPAPCRKLGHTPTPTQALVLQQRISIASCMAGVALDNVQRTILKPSAGIEPFGNAASPAINLLDEVIAYCDPETAIIAQHAKGDIYVSLAVRLRNTVPAGLISRYLCSFCFASIRCNAPLQKNTSPFFQVGPSE